MNNTSKKKGASVLVIIFALITIISLAAAGLTYKKYTDLKNNPAKVSASSKQAAEKEAKDLKSRVAKLIDLPENEIPIIGTVNDKTKFKDQPFFNGVENGDKLLIFSEARKAVIYREKDNKLINVGPIAVTSEKTTDTDTEDDSSTTTTEANN